MGTVCHTRTLYRRRRANNDYGRYDSPAEGDLIRPFLEGHDPAAPQGDAARLSALSAARWDCPRCRRACRPVHQAFRRHVSPRPCACVRAGVLRAFGAAQDAGDKTVVQRHHPSLRSRRGRGNADAEGIRQCRFRPRLHRRCRRGDATDDDREHRDPSTRRRRRSAGDSAYRGLGTANAEGGEGDTVAIRPGALLSRSQTTISLAAATVPGRSRPFCRASTTRRSMAGTRSRRSATSCSRGISARVSDDRDALYRGPVRWRPRRPLSSARQILCLAGRREQASVAAVICRPDPAALGGTARSSWYRGYRGPASGS